MKRRVNVRRVNVRRVVLLACAPLILLCWWAVFVYYGVGLDELLAGLWSLAGYFGWAYVGHQLGRRQERTYWRRRISRTAAEEIAAERRERGEQGRG